MYTPINTLTLSLITFSQHLQGLVSRPFAMVLQNCGILHMTFVCHTFLWRCTYSLCVRACTFPVNFIYIYDVDCVLSMYYHLKWNKSVSRTRKRNGKLAGLFYVRIGCVVITNTTSRFCSTLFTSQVVQWPRPAMTCLTQVTRWTLDL